MSSPRSGHSATDKLCLVLGFMAWLGILIAVGVPIMIHEFKVVVDFWRT